MNWKAPWYKRLISFLIWTSRRFVYRLLGLPDEIEESIGGLNWGMEQNQIHIKRIEELLKITDCDFRIQIMDKCEEIEMEEFDVEAERTIELPDGTIVLLGAKIIKDENKE